MKKKKIKNKEARARFAKFKKALKTYAGKIKGKVSVKEVAEVLPPYRAVDNLNMFGGFPEPFLFSIENKREEALKFASRWKNQYYTDLVREDILEFSRIQEIKTIRLLLDLLRSRVGSPLSYKAIAEDLQISPNSVKKYVSVLESLYIIFFVRPFHRNIARAILKEPKVYFYNSSYVEGDEGVKLENTVAVSLLKDVQFRYDAKGENISLNYLRTKENKKVDFVVVSNKRPVRFIEVKLSDRKPATSLVYFSTRFPDAEFIQLVHNLPQEETIKNINLLRTGDWLKSLTV